VILVESNGGIDPVTLEARPYWEFDAASSQLRFTRRTVMIGAADGIQNGSMKDHPSCVSGFLLQFPIYPLRTIQVQSRAAALCCGASLTIHTPDLNGGH
jgi:hypothetical protein